jgi:hypothetical protein
MRNWIMAEEQRRELWLLSGPATVNQVNQDFG